MSFRINTNIAAMNALRNLNSVNDELAKSLERLASGLRINTAADDPSGLIASESFRAQMAGIDQAVKNSETGVSYAKTADGALSEINDLLLEARALALASTSSSLTAGERTANQSQLASIVDSISRLADTTQFGNKKLLDGSAGVQSSVTSANVSAMNFGGSFGGVSLSSNSLVTVAVDTAATKATLTGSVVFTGVNSKTVAGSFSINGTSFTTTSSTTVTSIVGTINAASATTGVSASIVAGQGVVLTSTQYGSAGNFTLSDANGVLNAAGTVNATGIDAVANVTLDSNGAAAGGLVTATFTGGLYGQNGLALTDANGNSLTLSVAGNVVGAAYTAGNLIVNPLSFQIGADGNQSVSLSIRNFDPTQLGTSAIAGKNLGNMSLGTTTSSSDALKVIDAATDEVTRARGEIGGFQKYTLESNINSLGAAREQIAASESAIREVDVAEEMTNLTRLQVMQQAGLAVLAQANLMYQSVLKLL